ncbi:MAG: hypothetical protein RCO49_09110 [Rickettsia endosymbiont of Argas persicus]
MNTKEPKTKNMQTVNVNDTSIIVTREYLISLLRAWQQNKITTARFYETIEIIHASSDSKYLDWENDGELVTWESVTSEIIAYFEMLDLDYITQEDIESIIEFLNTPIGKFDEGWKKWQQFEYSTNIEERIKKLNGQYPYIDLYKQNEGTIVTNMNYDIIVTREYLISLLRCIS